MTENEFDQDIELQAKHFRDHDEQVDRLNKQIIKLENLVQRQSQEVESLLLKQRQWNQILNLVGFSLGGFDPSTFEPGGEINEHVVMLAVPRMTQLIRLGEQFETLIRAADTNDVTRSQLQQLAMTIKLADVSSPDDTTA